MRTFRELVHDLMLYPAGNAPPAPRDEMTPGGGFTQMDILDAPAGNAPPAPRDEMTPGGGLTQMDLLDALPQRARVERYGAMMATDFMACTTVKARAIRSLPVHVMRKGPRGPERADDHPLARVLRRPNALMAWGDLASWAVIRRDVLGTAYIRVIRDGLGAITEMRPVIAPVTVSFEKGTGAAVYSAQSDWYNDPWTCREDGVLVLKTDVSEDGGRTGRSIAELAADDIGLSVDLSRFYRAILENGNHFQGYLETDKDLGPADIQAIQASLDTTKGAENAGKMRIFDRGLKYRAVSAQLEHMDIIEQEKWVLSKVCRACHVDPHHVYAESGAAATASQGYDLDFAKNTVLPEVTAWEEAFQVLLDRAASLGGKPSDLYVKFNMTGLERADMKSRYEAYRIAVYAGILTRARVCELEDEPWLPGQDSLLQPTAYYVLDGEGVPYAPDPRTVGTSGQADGLSGIDPKAVEDSIRWFADDARDRIAKRVSADGDCPKTRAYAIEVMRPIARAAQICGVKFDMDTEISDEIERSCWDDRA